jgi:hypothetical protein
LEQLEAAQQADRDRMAAEAATRKARKEAVLATLEVLLGLLILALGIIAFWWLLTLVVWPLLQLLGQAFWSWGQLAIRATPEVIQFFWTRGPEAGRRMSQDWNHLPLLLRSFIVLAGLALGVNKLHRRLADWVKRDDGKPH